MSTKRSNAFLAFIFLQVALFCAASSPVNYQLCGKVLRDNGVALGSLRINVTLQGTSMPFLNRTLADSAGVFKFKNLRSGTYLVVLTQEYWGELRKTVDIGPSFADAEGRVFATMKWDSQPAGQRNHTIAVTTLSVSGHAWRLYDAAMNLLGKYDAEAAVHKLEEAVQTAPHFGAAWSYLGSIAYQAHQFARAELCFREAFRLEPASGFTLINMGGVLLSENKYEEALPFNLQAVEAAPNDALARVQLGLNYFWLGKESEAETQLKEAKKSDPAHFSYPQLILSDIYKSRENYSGMIREFEEFLRLHPDSNLVNAVRVSLLIARQALSRQSSVVSR